jgi:hypothetical protein
MVFSLDETDRFDWSLLESSAVNLFWQMEDFARAISNLVDLKYQIHRLRFENTLQFQHDVSIMLKWQEQFGYFPWSGNLNALDEAFYSEPLNSTDECAICIENYDALVNSDSQYAYYFLDIIERHSRNYLLMSKRLIGLIQTNDITYQCRGIGKRDATWYRGKSL